MLKLNEERGGDGVGSFWVENGENPGEWYANVVHITEAMSGDDLLMDEVDDLCGIVSDRLEDLVTYTYCWFRTKKELEKDFPHSIKLSQAS